MREEACRFSAAGGVFRATLAIASGTRPSAHQATRNTLFSLRVSSRRLYSRTMRFASQNARIFGSALLVSVITSPVATISAVDSRRRRCPAPKPSSQSRTGNYYLKGLSWGAVDLMKNLMTVKDPISDELVITFAKCMAGTQDPQCQ